MPKQQVKKECKQEQQIISTTKYKKETKSTNLFHSTICWTYFLHEKFVAFKCLSQKDMILADPLLNLLECLKRIPLSSYIRTNGTLVLS